MNSRPPVLVLGAGAWGTALALHASRAGCPTTLWSRAALATRESPRLPGHPIPNAIRLATALDGPPPAMAILAIPTQHLRAVSAALPPGPALIVACKGIEAATGRLPLEILAETHPGARTAVLSGPNFAAEIAAGLPAAAVLAATGPAFRAAALAALHTPTFRLYGNEDTVGVQLGGAAKNVVALAAGAVIGAGLGENARAALVTRGLAEIARLVSALGGRAETVSGLSGLGDLLLTCTGPGSRNFRCGLALGQGRSLADAAAAAGGTVEGLATAPALLARAGPAMDLPICAAVARLVSGQTTLHGAIADLLARPSRNE